MLEWYQKLTLPINSTKTMLVTIESLGDDLQHRIFKNEQRVVKYAA